jgi:guanidinopropionase
MVHFDSHTDLFTTAISAATMYTHGTPFRRAVEEGLLDPARVIRSASAARCMIREDRDFADASASG